MREGRSEGIVLAYRVDLALDGVFARRLGNRGFACSSSFFPLFHFSPYTSIHIMGGYKVGNRCLGQAQG